MSENKYEFVIPMELIDKKVKDYNWVSRNDFLREYLRGVEYTNNFKVTSEGFKLNLPKVWFTEETHKDQTFYVCNNKRFLLQKSKDDNELKFVAQRL